MKTAIKWILAILGLFTALLLLNGILTCGWFAWWMIPTGIVCTGYVIAFAIVEIRKIKKGEW